MYNYIFWKSDHPSLNCGFIVHSYCKIRLFEKNEHFQMKINSSEATLAFEIAHVCWLKLMHFKFSRPKAKEVKKAP